MADDKLAETLLELAAANQKILKLEEQVEAQAEHLGRALHTIHVYEQVDRLYEKTYPKDLSREYDNICYRLELLTPQGSEYFRNPDRCLAYLEYDYQSGFEYGKKAVKLERELEALKRTINESRSIWWCPNCEEWIDYAPRMSWPKTGLCQGLPGTCSTCDAKEYAQIPREKN
jgi:hypothetical protein